MWDHKTYKLMTNFLIYMNKNKSLHYQQAIKLDKMNNILSIIIIILTGGASITSFLNIKEQTKAKFILDIIIGTINVLVCVLVGIAGKLKMEEESARHRVISDEYGNLVNLVETTLYLTDKPNAQEFVCRIRERLEVIQRYGPTLDEINDLPIIEEREVTENDIRLFLSETTL